MKLYEKSKSFGFQPQLVRQRGRSPHSPFGHRLSPPRSRACPSSANVPTSRATPPRSNPRMLRKLEISRNASSLQLSFFFLFSFDADCIDTEENLQLLWMHLETALKSFTCMCHLHFLIRSLTVKHHVCQERRSHNNYNPHPCSFWPTILSACWIL